MLFPNRLGLHALKTLARISLRDVALVRNKHLIFTSDPFLVQNDAFKRTVSVQWIVLQLSWEKILWAMR